ncbi:MAG: S1-like domain-containing RNA-binding protein [Paenibacillaceae bacterium]
MMQAGTVAELLIDREVSPNGYYLTSGTKDVLLHYSEVVGEIHVGERVNVFLFHDTEDRLTATMREPKLKLGELGLLEVVDVHPALGIFLEIGLTRHVLFPMSELPLQPNLRPKIGDQVFTVLGHDKQGRLLAKWAGEHKLAELAFHAPTSWKNRWVDAIVYKPIDDATYVLCPGGVLGFGVIGMIHESERTRPLRLGETVNVRVTFVREDGRVNLSMRPLKQQGREDDADRLLAFLKERPNLAMPYSDETSAEIIMNRFNLSKSAFKRAIGKLMKDGLVYQKGSWTHLKEDVAEDANPKEAVEQE